MKQCKAAFLTTQRLLTTKNSRWHFRFLYCTGTATYEPLRFSGEMRGFINFQECAQARVSSIFFRDFLIIAIIMLMLVNKG